MSRESKVIAPKNIVAVACALCILIAGAWVILQLITNHLLYENATTSARRWASYLADNVSDLEQIAAGEQPSSSSMAFFLAAPRSGQVYRYEIFNREGFPQLVAEHSKISLVDLSHLDSTAAASIKSGRPIVNARAGMATGEPSYFSQAYVPVISNGKPIAIVAAFVDQTDQYSSYYQSFVIAALALCGLNGVAFAVPTMAWYRRSREKQNADRRIRYLAHHDVLTGLANRAQLIEKLGHSLLSLSPNGPGLAIHFVDLDHFKDVNDTLGHDGGDCLLKTVAERLMSHTRAEDVVARIGGDEFIIMQTNVAEREQAEQFANRVVTAIREPMQFNDHEIIATVSVGIACAPSDGATSEQLLKSADLALYRSKAEGRNCIRCFQPDMDAELQARLQLERTIREAAAHDKFQLYYQPLFEVSGRVLTGFEALIRLPGPDGKMIPPMQFISVAEEMRLIDKIGKWVLSEACKTAATWPSPLTVAVNLSPAQFLAGSISEVVACALNQSGLPGHRLELEITESLLLNDSTQVLDELRKLKDMGVLIAMDDFGTGYSSLSYLWKFPFDKIKIDRSFMEGSGATNRDAQTVVKTIIALGRELHMRVTVEGVETSEQLHFLDTANGDQAQGFFFGRPMPADQIGAGLLSHCKANDGINAMESRAA